MKISKLFFAALISLVITHHAFSDTIPYERLNRLADNIIEIKSRDIGYPGNHNVQLNDFYQWYLDKGLSNAMMNNAGDPLHPHESPNTHVLEKEVIEFFAPLYGFDENDKWGLVTFSGTDGNNHGLYFGSKYLKAKTGKAPIVYVSEEAHYSIKRLADVQNLDMKLIPADAMGYMKTDELEKAIDPSRPALIVIAMGTTFKGAIDNQKAIDDVIRRKKLVATYRHLDAALFGGYLPFTPYSDLVNRKKIHFDSIAVSGHKFFGIDEPAGIFLTTNTILKNQNPYKIAYLDDSMPMINCSRSALGPLKLWWVVRKNGKAGFTAQARQILESTVYLKNQLQKLNYPHWVNEYSNTVFFKRPGHWVVKKWHLAQDSDTRFGGELAHIVVMQHVSKQAIDTFIQDLQTDMKATGKEKLKKKGN